MMSFRMLHLHNLKPLYAPDASATGGTDTGHDPDKTGTGDAKFTQADLDRIIGERLSRAEEGAVKKLLESLGLQDADELKGKLGRAAELDAAQWAELERARSEAADWKAKAEQADAAVKTATQKANESLMRAAVMMQAAHFHDPNEAWLYADKTRLTVKDDGAVEGAKEAVEAVVKAKPHLVKPERYGKGTPRSGGGRGGNSGRELPKVKVSL
jgi:hypothetical protein